MSKTKTKCRLVGSCAAMKCQSSFRRFFLRYSSVFTIRIHFKGKLHIPESLAHIAVSLKPAILVQKVAYCPKMSNEWVFQAPARAQMENFKLFTILSSLFSAKSRSSPFTGMVTKKKKNLYIIKSPKKHEVHKVPFYKLEIFQPPLQASVTQSLIFSSYLFLY